MRKQLMGAVAIMVTMLTALLFVAEPRAASRKSFNDDEAKLLGDWTGESICVGDNSACHDEKVVYHIYRSTDEPGKLRLAADKIIDGKPELMYVLNFKYDSEKRTLTGEFQNARYHGLWEYTVTGETMEGTLKLLPAGTIVRRIKVKKNA